MKRILLACFLLTATCTLSFFNPTVVHATIPTTVTASDFTAKVNLMDAQIGAGNMTAAQATWLEIHDMEMAVLNTSKHSIASAATPADKATYTTINSNQYSLYRDIWALKNDLATNRVAIHAKLMAFAATIY
jgi:hypothetical protein